MASRFIVRSTGLWKVKWRCGRDESGKPVYRVETVMKHPDVKLPIPPSKTLRPPHAVEQAFHDYKERERAATSRLDVVSTKPLELEPFLAARVDSVEVAGAKDCHRAVKRIVDQFLAYCRERGIRLVTQVTSEICRSYMESRAKAGIAWSTIAVERMRLQPPWTDAVNSGRLAVNPWKMAKVKRSQLKQEHPPFWAEDEVAQLLAVCRPWLRDLLTVLLHSGLRITSALSLRWKDIDWTRDVIHVRAAISKSGRPYDAPLLDAARDVLQRMSGNDDPEALVFPGPRSGKQVASCVTYLAVKRAVERAGIRDHKRYNHICRHTFATWAVQRGVPLKVVSTWLGHSSVQVTEIYAHVETSETQRWGEVFTQKAPAVNPSPAPRPNRRGTGRKRAKNRSRSGGR